ncbi:OmpH family outer membrane protein [Parvularcula sp. ZS-1/3]|uniref:OmpH family outer membrane protein n=1 Tax=Parvularcula mediterranea TaxID=2732508 RepID=A0A7Y3RM87_9PROT|nr:OmpH family outer membrane protein [Parvularcula mediterranea]NNU16693.1 OmpH family outer membrane protein [Parvularcula mediterranea]
MTNLFKITAALILAAATFASSAAFAQRGNILFLDQQRVVSESQAGQSIDSQLRVMTEEIAVKIKQQQSAIEAESIKLRDERGDLTDEEFQQRYQTILAAAQSLEKLKQIREAEMTQARGTAIQELREQWEPISEAVFKKRKGYVLLEKQAVLAADDRGDITDEVIAQLDKVVQRIQVNKPDLIAAAAAAQQQQQAAAQAQLGEAAPAQQ